MTSLPAGIASIIFDLGGVIIDLATEKTAKAFATLAGISESDVFQAHLLNAGFTAFEKGEMGSNEFRDAIRTIFSITATDYEIDACWNAMLVGLPAKKLILLEKLRAHFKTFLLSNTNAIHLSYIEAVMLNGRVLDTFFHKTYCSHKVGMRKPDPIIYKHILEQNNLAAEQTIFLDDNKENIEAAKLLGIQTIHIANPDRAFDIFKKYD